MRERPILFSAPMVRAILEGRKTQTRRVVKLPHTNPLGEWEPTTFSGTDARGAEHPEQAAIWHTRTGDCMACPYGIPGDRLWVRETWRHTAATLDEARALTEDIASGTAVAYRATAVDEMMRHGMSRADAEECCAWDTWKPSIHMARWASRITLEVTGVRVERLRSLSEADAIAEGIRRVEIGSGYPDRYSATPVAWSDVIEQQAEAHEDPCQAFRDLWESINGTGSWDANPWVWVVEFRRTEVARG